MKNSHPLSIRLPITSGEPLEVITPDASQSSVIGMTLNVPPRYLYVPYFTSHQESGALCSVYIWDSVKGGWVQWLGHLPAESVRRFFQ